MKTLHFTLGPVQGFVSQARRTRDLWAGSFLLSYLTGHAMKAVLDNNGTIAFPKVSDANGITDPLLAAICKKPLKDNAEPKIGSLPNRFKATVPDDFCGKLCEQAVQNAWENIATKVWDKFFPHLDAKQQQNIWNEQVGSFWDISWVIGASPDGTSDNAWLDQRKNWRSYLPPVQNGDKCTLMGSWQELSGIVGTTSAGKEKQKEFWDSIRKHHQIGDLNLGESERLCAIALIKRLFPYVAREAIGWQPGDVTSWPSTTYFAAVPWLMTVKDKAAEQARAYPELVEHHLREDRANSNSSLSGLSQSHFNKLDGRLFYRHSIDAEKDVQRKDVQGNCVSTKYKTSEAEAKKALTSHLKEISAAVGYEPSPFYALLLMDGDSLGKLLRKLEPTKVSSALADFTEQVEPIVDKYGGKTVYAGGDDVLALLPLDQALGAAMQLRNVYLEAFVSHVGTLETRPKDEHNQPLKTTISAGLVFAHFKTSLRAVLAEAHHMLDTVAKDDNDRDSIAVSVLTGSGRTVQWCSSWTDTSISQPIPTVLQDLSEKFEEQFASKFFYNVRQRFEVLTGDERERKKSGYVMPEDLNPYQLLLAEYKKSREHDVSEREAEERVAKLLQLCRVRKGTCSQAETNTLNISGAMLVRFLATKGRGIES